MTIDDEWLVTVINCQKRVLIVINNLLIIINNLLIIIKNWWRICMSEIDLCLWPWISWSILYQMQKLMTVLEPSWRADFKTVPTFSIWLRITRVIQGLIQSSILGMHKIFRLHLCTCKMSVKHKLFTEESSPKGLEFRKQ